MNKLILIIDDDRDLRASMKLGLEKAGFAVITADSAEAGRDIMARIRPNAVVLDRMMGGADGLTLLGEIRRVGDATPVIMLTAMDGTENTIDGLSIGANDYMSKPFSMRELVLRIGNITSKTVRAPDTRKMPAGLAEENGEFYVHGNLLPLSIQEKSALSEMLTGAVTDAQAMTVKRLREKLSLANLAGFDIIAVRGRGYKIVIKN